MQAAGTLDIQIAIKSLTTSQDSYGEPIKSWTTYATVWAQKINPRISERFIAEQRVPIRSVTFRIYYISGMTETMQVVAEGVTYRITGIDFNDSQNWMQLTCEAIDPAASQ